jgi:hypothetical protein
MPDRPVPDVNHSKIDPISVPTAEASAYTFGLVLRSRHATIGDLAAAIKHIEPISASLCAGRQDRAIQGLPAALMCASLGLFLGTAMDPRLTLALFAVLITPPMLLGVTALLAGPGGVTASASARPGRAEVAGIRGPGPRPGLAERPAAFTGPGTFFSVAALSAQYAWAVGYGQVGSVYHTVIAHWNGRVWQLVPSPNPPGSDTLDGVAVTSTTNAWAVGQSGNRSLILHWNGKSWRQVPSPAGGNLVSVAATSAANAWAVGIAGGHMLLEHWNGRSWRTVRSPVSSGQLYSVTATSAGDAWAVGSSDDQIVMLHWNGRSWRRVPAPNPKYGLLNAVTATSAGNAWAVGTIIPPGALVFDVLIEHWNGRSWGLDPVSQPPHCGCWLLGVGASSARNAWAVGSGSGLNQSLIMTWNGKAWQ